MRTLLIGAAIVLHAASAAARPLEIAAPFSDYAVLQHDAKVPVWGTADPGETVTVQLDGQTAQTISDAAGNWRADLPSGAPRSGATLAVAGSGGGSLRFTNIAVGEVWLCSGQSNMEFEAGWQSNARDIVTRSADPGLHLLQVPRQRSAAPSSRFARPAGWVLAAPASVAGFSAVCHAMGAAMRAQHPEMPIGLISASWGGSRIEDWLSRPALLKLGGFEGELAQIDAHVRDPAATDAVFDRSWQSWLDARARSEPGQPDIAAGSLSEVWENWGEPALEAFDGIGTYRLAVTLDTKSAQRARFVRLGQIDDIDRTTINGKLAGTTTGWDIVRRYRLASGMVKAGRNAIAVLVVDTGGGGGLYGSQPRGIELDDGSLVPFDTDVRFAPGVPLDRLPPIPVAPWHGGEGLASLDQGMIAPLGSYRLRGFAWYQGEANVARAAAYPAQLRALIADWRSRFGGRDFLTVQLASFGRYADAPAPSKWAALREAQRQVALTDADVRLVPAIDIGDPYDIHPTNKRELGRRLMLAAVADWAEPREHVGVERQDTRLILHLPVPYRLVGGARTPPGFELCDIRDTCRFADSSLEAADRIVFTVSETDRKLRYLWADSAFAGLIDGDGVPLPPMQITFP